MHMPSATPFDTNLDNALCDVTGDSEQERCLKYEKR